MKLATLRSVISVVTAVWPHFCAAFDPEKMVQRRAELVTQEDLVNLKLFAEYSAACGCNSNATVGSLVACSNSACPTVMSDGSVVQATLDSNTATNIQGYIATDPARALIVVTFRGSASIRNYIADILFLTASCDDLVKGCAAHAGFLAAWDEVQTAVLATVTRLTAANPTYSVVVVGHSLGGAVGTLAAAHLRVAGFNADLYTYGSPRVGNEIFSAFVTAQTGGAEYRVTHVDDPVPRLPPLLLGYRHVSPEYWLDDGNATTTAYEVDDIKVCGGTANITCNGGTTGFDTTAHGYYFKEMGACSTSDLPFRRDVVTISDADLKDRLNIFAALDHEYATALADRAT